MESSPSGSTVGGPAVIARLRAIAPWSWLLIGLALAYALWTGVAPTDSEVTLYVSDGLPIALAAAAAVASGVAARRARTPATARAWWWFATAFALRAVADAVWAWLEVVRHEEPFPSVADVGYLLFYPALLAGFWSLPTARRANAELARLALDASTVVVAGVVAVWYFMLAPTITAAETWSAAVVLNVIYPVGDMLLVVALGKTMMRRTDSAAFGAIQWLFVGTAALLAGDLAFGHLSLADSYDGSSWPDVCWIVGLAAFTIAALIQQQHAGVGARRRVELVDASTHHRISVAPYVAVALSCAILLKVVYHDAWYPTLGVVLGAVIVTTLVVARQVTAMRDYRQLLFAYQRLATTDPLTGLATRRHFLDITDDAFDDQVQLCVLMLDIDRFKQINDVHGHHIGDAALHHVAGLCQANIRAYDAIAGRFGGDELVITLFGADLAVGARVAERIHSEIAQRPLRTADGDVPITVSIGVAERTNGAARDVLLETADRALYSAKAGGRNRVFCAAIDG